MAIATLNSTQRYAAAALLALALRQAQIHQTRPLGSEPPEPDSPSQERSSNASGCSAEEEGGESSPHLWTHESQGLLRPIFRFLDVDQKAWVGLEETAASSEAKFHVGAYLRMIFEEDGEESQERVDLELALAKAVDAMEMSLQSATNSNENQNQLPEANPNAELTVDALKLDEPTTNSNDNQNKLLEANPNAELTVDALKLADSPANYQRKISLLYELLSACVADIPPEDEGKSTRFRKGYDARHRAALRLLSTWLNVKWVKMEAIEIIVASSAMAAAKELKESQGNESPKTKWQKWRKGGIIGAAALTGGALLAITGGLAAPAIAAGFSALAPTLGTLVPVIGASGFAAFASAAGSVAGSVAVAASFGAAGAGLSGTKMARRIGDVKEFEFKPIGENHNQGRLAVGILISGFVFEEEDFLRPWDGYKDNLERYALQWESKNLIAVSTAIQDWITSSLTLELMKRGAMLTVLSSLVTAFAFPAALLTATNWIDSKWAIAIDRLPCKVIVTLDRSDKAGKLLAEVLLKGLQGNRPVTLVGSSLGARVIFKCLQELAVSGHNEGLVERVVLLGAPVSVQGEHWEAARKMVAGRFINAYSTNDWILGITFRASLLTQGLAGIQAVDIPGVENVDVTDLIEGHSSYLTAVQGILQRLELETYYPVFATPTVDSSELIVQLKAT
ncbi:transmembrane and coiled-coil domain-containing protein STS1-like isoform X3 [Carex rostrata]